MKNLIKILLTALVLTSCLSNEPFNLEYQGFEPIRLKDDWQISTPEDESVNREMLEQAYQLIYKDDRILVTVSAGIASRKDFKELDETIEEADRMLYNSKNSGRNRVSPDLHEVK